MEDETQVLLAHVLRDLLLQEGADHEIRLHGVHALPDMVRGYCQPKLDLMTSKLSKRKISRAVFIIKFRKKEH